MKLKPKYKRILLKISGEALGNANGNGFSHTSSAKLACCIQELHKIGVQVAIVVGGGNIFRGKQAKDLHLARVAADQMGMLATVMNGLLLQQELIKCGLDARVMSSIAIDGFVEPYSQSKALRHLDKGRVLLFVGGTGSPFFTTDTAAALRASEIMAPIIFKGTKVNGVYTADPIVNPKAKKLAKISYDEVLQKDLQIMDATAITLCRENKIEIYVFKLLDEKAIINAVCGKMDGSLIS